MKQFLARGLVVVAGVVSLPASISHMPLSAPVPDYREDPRLSPLRDFFSRIDSPAIEYAPAFLEAADEFGLDWRLLPGIAYVESTCGKLARNNNLFGWDSGRADFPSPIAGIQAVAHRLTHSRLYRDKSLDEILATYNPQPDYARKVKSIMRRIATSE